MVLTWTNLPLLTWTIITGFSPSHFLSMERDWSHREAFRGGQRVAHLSLVQATGAPFWMEQMVKGHGTHLFKA
jgi:hypothetical protein